ncbi:MAG: universal stress protein [Rhodobacteraceae bacterium]|nr:universal stress protein [Paracoccaceae bacterium]
MPLYIVATDLSIRADRALRRAFDLAARNGARLIVLSVVDDSLPAAVADRLAEEARSQLSATCAALGAGCRAGHELRVIPGDPLPAIAATALREAPDLLVLGLHRTRPVFDSLRETTMQLLVRAGLCPTLLVRDPAERPYRRILAATDFSPASAAAIRAARALAPEAMIHAVHAVHVPFAGLVGDSAAYRDAILAEAGRARDEWLATLGVGELAGPVALEPGPVGEVLGAAIARLRPDLLALGAHGRGQFAEMVLGSLTGTLLRDPPVDLLVAQPPRG